MDIHIRLTQCLVVVGIDIEAQGLDLVVVTALSVNSLDGLRGSAVLVLDEITAVHHDPGHGPMLVVLEHQLQFRIEARLVEEDALLAERLHAGPALEPVGQIHPGGQAGGSYVGTARAAVAIPFPKSSSTSTATASATGCGSLFLPLSFLLPFVHQLLQLAAHLAHLRLQLLAVGGLREQILLQGVHPLLEVAPALGAGAAAFFGGAAIPGLGSAARRTARGAGVRGAHIQAGVGHHQSRVGAFVDEESGEILGAAALEQGQLIGFGFQFAQQDHRLRSSRVAGGSVQVIAGATGVAGGLQAVQSTRRDTVAAQVARMVGAR